jgi:hypothetical protein
VYKPDPRIVKYLKEYDRDLGARWADDKWEITWSGKHAWNVCEEDGSFRPLDERVVTQAKLQDLWQHRSGRELMKMQSEENHRIEGLNKKGAMDDFRQRVIEEGHQEVFGVGQFSGWSPNA